MTGTEKRTREHTLVLLLLINNLFRRDMEDFLLVRLDTDYCNYLRKFDYRVPDYVDRKEKRPFVGVLFEVHNCKYFAPLSSPKEKHKNMKSSIDFLKIDDGKLGAINFNNMLPVTDKNIIIIDLNIKNENNENHYVKLLRQQLYWLNRHNSKVYSRSQKLYSKYINNKLNINIRNRCCDFKLLEEKCKIYNKIK